MPLDLSVVIIAYNEESNIERCLKSLPAGADVVVLDSQSQDRTADIARALGARVSQRPFTNFAEQKNAALSLAQRGWILTIDADEELSPELRGEIPTLIQTSGALAYRLDRRLVFMGRRMHFGKTRDRPLRLFRKGSGQYEGAIHEEFILREGTVRFLRGSVLWHYSYKDLSDYFQRFNRYTSAIAAEHAKKGQSVPMLSHLLRPWLEFFSRYVLRLGFLDGYPGYTYALVSSLYAYIKYAKLRELRRHAK